MLWKFFICLTFHQHISLPISSITHASFAEDTSDFILITGEVIKGGYDSVSKVKLAMGFDFISLIGGIMDSFEWFLKLMHLIGPEFVSRLLFWCVVFSI